MSWAGWIMSRLVVLALLVADPALGNDTKYWSGVLGLGRGVDVTLVEYPVPAYAVLWVPVQLTRLVGGTPAVTFVLLFLALDAAFHALLVRHRPSGRLALAGELTWIASAPALGAVSAVHFDIVTGVLVGAALVLGARSSGAGAALATVAAGIKYWPAIVLPAIVLGARSRGRAAWTVVLVGAALAGGSLAIADAHRLFTPLTWQGERGLQLESVAATPAVVGHLVDPGRFRVAFTDHQSFEMFGPGTAVALTAATVGSGLLVALLGVLWWRGRHFQGAEVLVWTTLTATTGFIVVDKVFSPQYLLWLTPIAAAGLLRVRPSERARLAAWSVGLVAACVATQLGPVLGLWWIVDSRGGVAVATVLLVARNALMVGLFAYAGVRALHLAKQDERYDVAGAPGPPDDSSDRATAAIIS
ncbi:glycosyltransferase family 87 protein [Nocardioides panacihumi]|uniref:Glycosyltransferase family 87 protein n=2 Tax=Nocardioides panacihumi TaxID=400774 RepID=A0ABN2R1N3_9ACTN